MGCSVSKICWFASHGSRREELRARNDSQDRPRVQCSTLQIFKTIKFEGLYSVALERWKPVLLESEIKHQVFLMKLNIKTCAHYFNLDWKHPDFLQDLASRFSTVMEESPTSCVREGVYKHSTKFLKRLPFPVNFSRRRKEEREQIVYYFNKFTKSMGRFANRFSIYFFVESECIYCISSGYCWEKLQRFSNRKYAMAFALEFALLGEHSQSTLALLELQNVENYPSYLFGEVTVEQKSLLHRFLEKNTHMEKQTSGSQNVRRPVGNSKSVIESLKLSSMQIGIGLIRLEIEELHSYDELVQIMRYIDGY